MSMVSHETIDESTKRCRTEKKCPSFILFSCIGDFSLLHLHLESFLIIYFHSHHSTSYYDGHGFARDGRWKYQTLVAQKKMSIFYSF
jgi:hypothetical protein